MEDQDDVMLRQEIEQISRRIETILRHVEAVDPSLSSTTDDKSATQPPAGASGDGGNRNQ